MKIHMIMAVLLSMATLAVLNSFGRDSAEAKTGNLSLALLGQNNISVTGKARREPKPSDLVLENARLKEALQFALTELDALKKSRANAMLHACVPTDKNDAQQPQPTVKEESAQQQKAEAAQSIQRIADTAAEAFDHEGVELNWANPATQAIRMVWEKHRPNDASLLSVECRRTLCRLEIDSPRFSASEGIEFHILNELGDLFSGTTRQLDEQTESGREVLFLSRATLVSGL